MVKIHKNIEIKAPLKEVYAYLSNPRNEPEWMVGMQEIHNLSGSGAGTHFEWTYTMGGFTFKGESTRVEDDREKHFVAKTKGGIESTWTFDLEPRTEDVTVVNLDIEYAIPIPVLGALAEKIFSRRNEHDTDLSLLRIKEKLEARMRSWTGAERRNQDRKTVDLPCDLEGVAHGQAVHAKAKVSNLSRLGMYVRTDYPFDEGSEAQITVIQFGETFWVKGKVLRSMEKGMAIGFGQNVPRDIERILDSMGK